MNVFAVEAPTPEQARAIARNLYQGLARRPRLGPSA